MEYKLRRLHRHHRRWQQVHLWARKRAPWPTLVLGPEPVKPEDISAVHRWCRAKVIESARYIPRALNEYEAWWKEYRLRHKGVPNVNVLEIGDSILAAGKTLQTQLNKFKHNHTRKQLHDIYYTDKPEDFGLTESSSALEHDVWQDWKASLASSI